MKEVFNDKLEDAVNGVGKDFHSAEKKDLREGQLDVIYSMIEGANKLKREVAETRGSPETIFVLEKIRALLKTLLPDTEINEGNGNEQSGVQMDNEENNPDELRRMIEKLAG